jgi:hypothetical protein
MSHAWFNWRRPSILILASSTLVFATEMHPVAAQPGTSLSPPPASPLSCKPATS